ncbi:MAG TPA: hypothetical protein DCX52_08145 [Massilia sp.]|nr:hypothetical protein [Massilia sp.]
MSTSTDKKDVQGRSWDQITKDGTSSAGSMGTGGTGDIGSMSGQSGPGGSQQEARTDDLLASDSDGGGGAEGFQNPHGKGELQTGMEGIRNRTGNGAGNRQSGEPNQQGSGGMRSTETDRDQGSSAREDQQSR